MTREAAKGWIALTVMVLVGFAGGLCMAQTPNQPGAAPARPATVADVLCVWGNPEMAKPGPHTPATFADASPAERARLLGVSNIVMAGLGLPNDDRKAEGLAKEVAASHRLIWEIAPDGEGENRPFVYRDTIARVRRLADTHPQIEGVLLDDMSTIGIDRGFKPEHIREIRALLGDRHGRVKVWGAVYTMSFDRPGINDYMKELDGILLAVWHAKDVVRLEGYVNHCRRLFPDKPIILCLYLYDYGDNRRMPQALLEKQCATALDLTHAGRVQGIVFLTINNDPDAVTWTAEWVRQVGIQKIGERSAAPAKTSDCLQLGDGHDWNFVGGPWTQDKEGVIRPPDRRNLHSRAFCRTQAFKDLTAEFEFNGNYRETGTGSAGLILRATDAGHFTFVYFPWGGQQLRAKHFWAAVGKVDGDGYIRNLEAAYVPGVPSETDRWYKVRVAAEGPRIRVWVDGRKALETVDPAPQGGCVGLAGYGLYLFRNARFSGERISPPAWTDAAAAPAHAFTVGLSSEQMPCGCIAPNGDVLLAGANQLVRSSDKGMTWAKPETLPDKLGTLTDYGNSMFRTPDGRLIVMLYRPQAEVKKPAAEILIAESTDNGRTWSDPAPSQVGPNWPAQPKNLVPYGPLVATADGALLRFLLGGVKEENTAFTDVRTWSSIHCKAFAIRSTDGGKSWTAPIEIDRPSWTGTARGTIPGSLDFTEPTGVAIGNTVTVLIRPVYSETMWQCWSYDCGATWDAAARTTFPGYAQSMVLTQSGVILCAHRYPSYSVNISRDGGLNWDAGTVIDYPAWAMGCMVEVEPDVVLSTYMNAERGQPLLAQLIRVTPDGIRPVAR
jgi:hypothetical protein